MTVGTQGGRRRGETEKKGRAGTGGREKKTFCVRPGFLGALLPPFPFLFLFPFSSFLACPIDGSRSEEAASVIGTRDAEEDRGGALAHSKRSFCLWGGENLCRNSQTSASRFEAKEKRKRVIYSLVRGDSAVVGKKQRKLNNRKVSAEMWFFLKKNRAAA